MKKLKELAKKATPGPWGWFGYVSGPMYLATRHRGRQFVMQFARLGFQDAQPVFQHRDFQEKYGRMVKATALAVPEVDYRDDIVDIDNPDAQFIAEASPEKVLALIEVLEAVEALNLDCRRNDPKAGKYPTKRGRCYVCDKCRVIDAVVACKSKMR